MSTETLPARREAAAIIRAYRKRGYTCDDVALILDIEYDTVYRIQYLKKLVRRDKKTCWYTGMPTIRKILDFARS